MKKVYTILLIGLLSVNPLFAFATEDVYTPEDIESISNNSNTESIANDSSITSNSDSSSDTTEDVPTGDETDIPTTEPPEGTLPSDSIEDIESVDSVEEITDTVSDDETLSEEISSEEDLNTPSEHVHLFEYVSNNDGTHSVKCIAPIESDDVLDSEGVDEASSSPCDFLEIEDCTFDENDTCIYCGYVKPDEYEEFNPNISISITNRTCANGTNPVINLAISQADYDIAYAQVCFANYPKNQFINIGLAQGKYYNYQTEDFVYTADSNWYASPDITSSYSLGDYCLRSIFIRSTTGESVHYSLESDSLSEEYQDISLSITDIIPDPEPEPSLTDIEEPVDLSETDTVEHHDTRLEETEYVEPIELVPTSLVGLDSGIHKDVVEKPENSELLPDAEITDPIDNVSDNNISNTNQSQNSGTEDTTATPTNSPTIDSDTEASSASAPEPSTSAPEPSASTPEPSKSASDNKEASNKDTQPTTQSTTNQNKQNNKSNNIFNNILSFFKRVFRF